VLTVQRLDQLPSLLRREAGQVNDRVWPQARDNRPELAVFSAAPRSQTSISTLCHSASSWYG
jgi:hypothetical protein